MLKTKYIHMLALLLSAPSAFAGSDFIEGKPCGSAKVVAGDSCANAKVEFQFVGCDAKVKNTQATRIICDKNKVKARYQKDHLRYEAQFEKADDGWGAVAWNQIGPVKQFVKMDAVTQAEPASVPKEEFMSEKANPMPASEAAASPSIKFSAFADFRYTEASVGDDNPSSKSNYPESGFALEDGAVYANYADGPLTAMADIAFRREKNGDTGADEANASDNNNITIGREKSQLFFKYQILESLAFTGGQFDTPYGVELNDSKDRIFSHGGLVYNQALPVTHTGVMLEYLLAGVTFKALAANPNNNGTYGTEKSSGDRTEYGAAVSYSNDVVRTQVGYLSRSVQKADSAAGNDSRTLLDVTAGVTLGDFMLDLEWAQVTDPGKNTITDTVATDEEDSGSGIFALLSYKATEKITAGVRYETVSDDPGALGYDKSSSAGLALHYKTSDALTLRGEFINYDYENFGGTEWTDKRYSLGAMLVF